MWNFHNNLSPESFPLLCKKWNKITDKYNGKRDYVHSTSLAARDVYQQAREQGIVFPDEEQETLCLDDLIEQYILGDDNPQIRIDW